MNNLATLAAQCRTCAALVGQPLRDNLLAVAVEAEQIKKDSALASHHRRPPVQKGGCRNGGCGESGQRIRTAAAGGG